MSPPGGPVIDPSASTEYTNVATKTPNVIWFPVSRMKFRIVEEASERNCSAIILGSLRHTGLQAVLGHRTRERVVKMSPLPVVVAPRHRLTAVDAPPVIHQRHNRRSG